MGKEEYWRLPGLQHMRIADQIGWTPRGVAVDGSLLAMGLGMHLAIYGITSPAQPMLLGTSEALSTEPDFAHLHQLCVGQGRACLSLSESAFDTVCVFDVAITRHPRLLGRCASGHDIQDIVVHGGVLYIRGEDVLLLDFRDPAHPTVVDRWSTIEERWFFSEAVAVGNRCYIAAQSDGVLVLDIAPP